MDDFGPGKGDKGILGQLRALIHLIACSPERSITVQVSAEFLNEFVGAARKTAAYGLLRCSSGNMSCRLENDIAAITCSGSWLGQLTSEDVTICRISTQEVLQGKRPSVESRFHLGILANDPKCNVVLHYQSPYATAIGASVKRDWDFTVIGEIPFYIGSIGYIDHIIPGTTELADLVISAMKTHGLVILQNHGQVTSGVDYDDAIQKASFFELACQVLLTNPHACPMPKQNSEKLRRMAQGERI